MNDTDTQRNDVHSAPLGASPMKDTGETGEKRPDGGDEGDDGAGERTVEDLFANEENARDTARLIARFVASWERHKHNKAPEKWLAEELRRSSGIWADEAEAEATAREIVVAVEQANTDRASLHAHLNAGKSKASWIAGAIERGAAAAGATSVSGYAAEIEATLETTNEAMLGTVRTQSGAVSMSPNLDGFIAEQHHADTFNVDAAAKGSPLRAKVLGPEPGQPFRKNSMDIGVYDGNGKLVGRYQVKYGKDAESTQALFDKGDYRGQRKLVSHGQQSDIPGSTDVIEVGGVRSRPLTKAEAKQLQQRARIEHEKRQYDWNDVSRIEMAKSIGKQALVAAALATGFQGARIAARRIWNSIAGKENPPPSEDLREFFQSSVSSAGQVGAQVAVSGAAVVAARNGWIGPLRNTPAGRIVGMVQVGMENAKVLYKFAKGEMNGEEALEAMGSTTIGAIGGLAGAAKGAAVGAAGGPIGVFVGGVVGGMAGSKIGQAVYEGGKAIVKTAAKVVSAAVEGVTNAAKAVGRFLMNPLSLFS